MKIKTMYIKDVKPGERVSGSFLVMEKNIAFSQKGSPYLNIRLKDKTGEVDGKIWENAVEWDKVFKKGDVIRAQGGAVSFKNTIQISITGVKKVDDADIDLSEYLPVAKENSDVMFTDLMALSRRSVHPI
jgi:3'-5' exoribonuclease